MRCLDKTSSALITIALLHVANAAILSHAGTEVNWQTGRRGTLCHRVLSIAPHLERAVRLPEAKIPTGLAFQFEATAKEVLLGGFTVVFLPAVRAARLNEFP